MILEVQVPIVGDNPRPSKCEHSTSDKLYHDVALFRLEDEPVDEKAALRSPKLEAYHDNSVTIRVAATPGGTDANGANGLTAPPPPSRNRPTALDVNTHPSVPIICDDKQAELRRSAGRDLPFPFQTRPQIHLNSPPPPPPRPPNRERPLPYQPSARHPAMRARWENLGGEELHLHPPITRLHLPRSRSFDGSHDRHRKIRRIARSKSLDFSLLDSATPTVIPNRPPLRPRASTQDNNFFSPKSYSTKRAVHPKILVTDCSSPIATFDQDPHESPWGSVKRNLKSKTGHEMATISLESSPGSMPEAFDSFDSPNKIVRKSGFAALGRWLTGRSDTSPRESVMEGHSLENGPDQLLSPTQDGQMTDDHESRPSRSVSTGGVERAPSHNRQTSGTWLQAPKASDVSTELEESPEPARSYWWSPKLRSVRVRARSLDEGTLLNEASNESEATSPPQIPQEPRPPPKRGALSLSPSTPQRPFTATSPMCSPSSACHNPAQWLDANSGGVRELDLIVPVKHAGQLLRAIEASGLSDPVDDDVGYGLWNDVDNMVVGLDGGKPLSIPRFKASDVHFGTRIADGVYKGHLVHQRSSIAIKVAPVENSDGFDTLAEAFFVTFLTTKQPTISVVHCLGVVAACAPHSDAILPCLLLDCCDCSLEDVIKSADPMWGSLTVRMSLAIQLVQAVLDVHENGVVHRNIKPSSVLVTTVEQRHSIWLSDFKYANTTTVLPVSQSPCDMYFREREPDATSYPADVFALARVLACLLAKRMPKEDETDTISLKSVSKELCSLLDHCTRPMTILRSKRPGAKHVLRGLQAAERELQTQQAPCLTDPMSVEAAGAAL